MFVTTRLLESRYGVFQKGEEVSEKIAKEYFRYVKEVNKTSKAPKEELLVETPSPVDVKIEELEKEIAEETQELAEEIKEVKKLKKSKRAKK